MFLCSKIYPQRHLNGHNFLQVGELIGLKDINLSQQIDITVRNNAAYEHMKTC